MKSKLKKLIAKNEGTFYDTIYLPGRSLMFHTCCNCKSRHVFLFKVHETETGENFIELDIYSDELGTELRKYYDRENKKSRNK